MNDSHAVERVQGPADAPVLVTCEHASEALPGDRVWHADDAWLRGTHWAYDLGAREVVLELAEQLAAPAVLSRFTRLWIDPNREEDHVDLFRARADQRSVQLNVDVDHPERTSRLEGYYRPYHRAVDHALSATRAPVLLSIHSFTPVYEGQTRGVELGVLFNDDEPLARELGEHLRAGFTGVEYNEPWSGHEGLIYAAESHARRQGRRAIELEVRQDLATDAAYRARLVASVSAFFSTR